MRIPLPHTSLHREIGRLTRKYVTVMQRPLAGSIAEKDNFIGKRHSLHESGHAIAGLIAGGMNITGITLRDLNTRNSHVAFKGREHPSPYVAAAVMLAGLATERRFIPEHAWTVSECWDQDGESGDVFRALPHLQKVYADLHRQLGWRASSGRSSDLTSMEKAIDNLAATMFDEPDLAQAVQTLAAALSFKVTGKMTAAAIKSTITTPLGELPWWYDSREARLLLVDAIEGAATADLLGH